jgi:hypothetical protein
MRNFKDRANYRELVGRKLQRNDPRVILGAISNSLAASSKIEDWNVTNFFEPKAFEKKEKHMMLSMAVDHVDSPRENIYKQRSMKTQIEDSLEATYKKRPEFTLEYKKNEKISKLREAYRSYLLKKKSQSMSLPMADPYSPPLSPATNCQLGRFFSDIPKASTPHNSSSQNPLKSQSNLSVPIQNVDLQEYNKKQDQNFSTVLSNGVSGQRSLHDACFNEDCYETEESNICNKKSQTVSKKITPGYLLGDSEGLPSGQGYFYPKIKGESGAFGDMGSLDGNLEIGVCGEVFWGERGLGNGVETKEDPGWTGGFCFKRKETHLDVHKKKLAEMSHLNMLTNIREENNVSHGKRQKSQTFDSGILDTDPSSVNASRIINKYSKDVKYDDY